LSISTISESEINFQFESNKLYRIEDEEFYKNLTGVKVVDFIALKDDSIYFIEAKKTVPIKDKYSDLVEKLIGSILMFVGSLNGRKNTIPNLMPENFKPALLKKSKVYYIIIINDLNLEWLPYLSSFLQTELSPICNAFSIESTLILDKNQYKKLGFKIK
jgi:hypothetical protein